ncbi:MAG TPA: hypothetical protein VG796_28165 [Verrucomicrobiales bacterium]|jgi:hypothetical protein|nr:hypothetical protein [Verrucomicrobiales bacterium]
MTGNFGSPPLPHEAEIAVFGPGYGETIAVHAGNEVWMIVDSAVSADTGRPMVLDYLGQLGVDPKTAVRKLVVSHWDTDHILGLANTLEICKSAQVVMPSALFEDEVVKGICNISRGAGPVNPASEIQDVFAKIIAMPDDCVEYAVVDRDLVLGPVAEHVRFTCLSPTDGEISRCVERFTQRNRRSSRKRYHLPKPSENSVSIVLHCRFGEHHSAILGGDLEVQKSSDEVGWHCVIKRSKAVRFSKASCYKIAHHGSPTSDCDEIWSELLTANPFAAVTPYARGVTPRPNLDDIERILKHTSLAWLTAPPSDPPASVPPGGYWNLASIQKVAVPPPQGAVRFRVDMTDPHGVWRPEEFGNAKNLAEWLK